MASRDYFEEELRLKLVKKGVYSADDIESAIAEYKELGIISDEKFAVRFAAAKLLREGRHKVVSRLLAKGVDRALAKRAVEEAVEAEEIDEKAVFDAELKSKLESLGVDSLADLSHKERDKVLRSMYSKGFTISF